MYLFSSSLSTALRRASLLALGVVCLLAFTGQTSAKKRFVLERIIAVVNGDIVLWSEWRQRVQVFKARLGKTLDDGEKKKRLGALKKKMLNKMIDDKLLDQQVRKLQVKLTEQEVNAAVKDTQRKYNLSAEQFREALKEQGYTMVTYKAMVRRELKKLRLLQRVLRQKVNVSEEDIRKYYADMTRGMNPGPTEYRVRQILLPIPKGATAAQLLKLKQEANNILVLAKAKPTLQGFVGLVKRFSRGPWKDKNGDLGFLDAESLPKVIADEVKKFKKGKVHPSILKSKFGLHIVFLQATRNSGVLSYKEARPQIMKKLQQVGFQSAYKRYLKGLRKKAVIEIRLKPSEMG